MIWPLHFPSLFSTVAPDFYRHFYCIYWIHLVADVHIAIAVVVVIFKFFCNNWKTVWRERERECNQFWRSIISIRWMNLPGFYIAIITLFLYWFCECDCSLAADIIVICGHKDQPNDYFACICFRFALAVAVILLILLLLLKLTVLVLVFFLFVCLLIRPLENSALHIYILLLNCISQIIKCFTGAYITYINICNSHSQFAYWTLHENDWD